MSTIEVSKIESLEVDESAIALLVTYPGRMSPESRHSIHEQITRSIPRLTVPVLVLDGDMQIKVLKASDAKTLQELLDSEVQ
jgi:hypothetical protein